MLSLSSGVDLELASLKQLGKRIKHLHQKEMDALVNSYKNKGNPMP
jgi:hypothetical protein